MIHPQAEYWRSRRRSPYTILLPLWVTMWMLMGLVTAHWKDLVLYATPWGWVPGLLLLTSGFSLYRKAGVHFSLRQLGGLPELQAGHTEQTLVTSGVRSRVRHPIYLAHLCEMLGWSFGTGLTVCFGLTAFAIATGAVMIRLEDRELEKRFGEQFSAYRERVPAVWPKVRA
jgi:protein-S-isoprenylcysteine O-methyltransferase Ste14